MKLFCNICQLLLVLVYFSIYVMAIFLRAVDNWGIQELIIALLSSAVCAIVFLVLEYCKKEPTEEELEIQAFEEFLEKL